MTRLKARWNKAYYGNELGGMTIREMTGEILSFMATDYNIFAIVRLSDTTLQAISLTEIIRTEVMTDLDCCLVDNKEVNE